MLHYGTDTSIPYTTPFKFNIKKLKLNWKSKFILKNERLGITFMKAKKVLSNILVQCTTI